MPDSSLAQRYADVLFSHIDRLADPCPQSDPLARIARDLVAAFEQVARDDPAMNRTVARLPREGYADPYYPAGSRVFFAQPYAINHYRTHDVEARVLNQFRGKDGREYCVLEVQEAEPRYELKPVMALKDEKDGESNLDKALKHPEFARAFLARAGILEAENSTTEDPVRP